MIEDVCNVSKVNTANTASLSRISSIQLSVHIVSVQCQRENCVCHTLAMQLTHATP